MAHHASDITYTLKRARAKVGDSAHTNVNIYVNNINMYKYMSLIPILHYYHILKVLDELRKS